MKIKKGTLLRVNDHRKGEYEGEAAADFDTKKDEWYSIALIDEELSGINTTWLKGDSIPARRGMCEVKVIM